ncbi:MAG TPA: hypothetical protein VLR88_03985, partial [Propionibacteriaceae bacterium]|nr:hypothetical protein [Propionibacteriaceae bacterium]
MDASSTWPKIFSGDRAISGRSGELYGSPPQSEGHLVQDRLRRSIGSACAAALFAGLAMASQWSSAGVASADPQAVAKAQASLKKIEEQRTALDLEFSTTQEKLDDATAELKVVNADLTKQRVKVASLRSSISAVALQQFQSSGSDLAARLITSPDDTSFLNQIGRVESITARANDQVLEFRVAQADLTQLQGTAEAATATITASRVEQAALLKKLTAKETEAERVLAKLTAEERARLAAVEAAQQRQAALRASTTSRSDARNSSTLVNLPVASGRAAQAVAFARAQVGKAYVYGATGPNAYDCSGLTGAAYRSAGIS